MENNVLNSGSTLQNGKYKILDVLGQGGFGITYLAEQTGLGMKVAVKEFFMKGSCMRDSATSQVSVPVTDNKVLVGRCLKKFKSEARRIASLNNDHIVNIIDIFDENGTSYYVMKHLSGGSLADLVKKKGTLSESVSLMVIRDIADALKSVHGRGLLHLDIKPANILFDERGRAVLIDFGVSKYVDSQQDSTATSSLVGFSRGYAPLEQINATISSLSAATDIYALGGTLYTMITGLVPPDATEVMNQDGLPTWPGGIDQKIVAAIEAAMRPRRADRPQSIDEFLALLPEEKLSEVAAEPVPVGLDEGEDTVVSSSSGNDLSSITQPVRPAGKPLIVIASFMMAASIILAAFTLLRPGGSPVAPESGKGEELQHLVDSLSASAGMTGSAAKYYVDAVNGDALAQCNLGYAYEVGDGVPQNYTEAVKLYRLSADQGYARAQCNLGYMYEKGYGVSQSYNEAVKWYRLSADQGYATAQRNMGICYENGWGVGVNYAEAKRWYEQALKNGYSEAQKDLDRLARKM